VKSNQASPNAANYPALSGLMARHRSFAYGRRSVFNSDPGVYRTGMERSWALVWLTPSLRNDMILFA